MFKKPKIKKLNNKVIGQITKTMKQAGFVEVGIVNSDKHEGSELTVAQVGFYNEFGTESTRKFTRKTAKGLVTKSVVIKIPERPFLRSTVKDEKQAIRKLTKDLSKSMIKGKRSLKQSLGLLGSSVSDKVKKKIVDIRQPKNADSTILAKKSSNPLIGKEGQLLNSITWRVDSGKLQ